MPAQRIGEIIAGKRAITSNTDLRLCRFFGLTDGWWLRLQADYDTEMAKASLSKVLAKIRPWSEATEQTADARCASRSAREWSRPRVSATSSPEIEGRSAPV